MKMNFKNIGFSAIFSIAGILTFANLAFSTSEIIKTDANRRAVTAGVTNDASEDVTMLRLDPDTKRLLVSGAPSGTVTAAQVNISGAGATDRTQMPTLSANACTLRALSSNAGTIYIGGSTVTNASGANPGLPLASGDPFSNQTLTNLNQLYVATDNADDDIAYLCN